MDTIAALLTTGGHSAPSGIIAIGRIFKREAKFQISNVTAREICEKYADPSRCRVFTVKSGRGYVVRDGMRRSPAVNPPVLHGKGFGKTGGVERVENLQNLFAGAPLVKLS